MKLSRQSLDTDPVQTLAAWISDARRAGLGDEPVFTLATVGEDGAPDARVVVVRSHGEHGLTFYSDTQSPKGRHLEAEPRAALVAHWPQLQRQVRVRGQVHILSAAESDAAFASRPEQSKIGYWSNEQSHPIDDRASLERQLDTTIAEFAGRAIPRPEHWVVYRLEPDILEFWQSGERHLHDRISYTRTGGEWQAKRLQP